MISFLRKIRQRLIGTGQVGRYMLYAVGEIALAVIGILIALQINNHNEWKKDREKEQRILIQLVKNLQMNCDLLENWIKGNEYSSKDGEVVIDHFKYKKPYHDSLASIIWRAELQWNNELPLVGYEALKNEGFDILQNEELKESILHLFEVEYPSLQNAFSWGRHDLGIQEQEFDKNFLRLDRIDGQNGLRYVPHEPKRIFQNNYLHSIYVKRQRQRSFYNSNMNETLELSREVLAMVLSELGQDYDIKVN